MRDQERTGTRGSLATIRTGRIDFSLSASSTRGLTIARHRSTLGVCRRHSCWNCDIRPGQLSCRLNGIHHALAE
jgi:hypothetical protein